jgi:AraC-like DNA-binding protein
MDFEFGIVLEGAVELVINESLIKLKKGDGFFVAPNILHMSKQVNAEKNAVVFILNFPASFLASDRNSSIYEKYFAPFLNTRTEGFKISGTSGILSLLAQIRELNSSVFGYELECQKIIIQIWLQTLLYAKDNALPNGTENKHTERMKEILSYIYNNYGEKFTADDIAKHLNVSRGECFRCFKHFMNKPLVKYINEYRLQRAAALLRETEMPVTEISTKCGFENPGYFGKTFKEMYYIAPLQYRKAKIWTAKKTENTNGYDYEYWKDTGDGKMIITSHANNGSLLCEWSNIHNIVFRSGTKFFPRNKTHHQLGNITLKYDATFNSSGRSYLCVYGWMVEPLVEWYIVENYSGRMPMTSTPVIAEHIVDGNEYAIFLGKRKNGETILNTFEDFDQYWSVRKCGSTSGIVDVSKHFAAWENLGYKMGFLTEIALNMESLCDSGGSSGNGLVKTNIIEFAQNGIV